MVRLYCRRSVDYEIAFYCHYFQINSFVLHSHLWVKGILFVLYKDNWYYITICKKWMWLTRNNYLIPSNYLFWIGILEIIQLCANYLYEIGILETIQLCANYSYLKYFIYNCKLFVLRIVFWKYIYLLRIIIHYLKSYISNPLIFFSLYCSDGQVDRKSLHQNNSLRRKKKEESTRVKNVTRFYLYGLLYTAVLTLSITILVEWHWNLQRTYKGSCNKLNVVFSVWYKVSCSGNPAKWHGFQQPQWFGYWDIKIISFIESVEVG